MTNEQECELLDVVTENVTGRVAQYSQGLITRAEMLMFIQSEFGSDVLTAIIHEHDRDEEGASDNF